MLLRKQRSWYNRTRKKIRWEIWWWTILFLAVFQDESDAKKIFWNFLNFQGNYAVWNFMVRKKNFCFRQLYNRSIQYQIYSKYALRAMFTINSNTPDSIKWFSLVGSRDQWWPAPGQVWSKIIFYRKMNFRPINRWEIAW